MGRIDPRFARATLTWPVWAAVTGTSLVSGWLFSRAGVGALFGIETTAVALIVLSYPVSYAAAVLYRERQRALEHWFPLLVAHAVAVASALGACSRRELAAGWALLVVVPPCWGQLFPNNAVVATTLALGPLVLRALTVRGGSLGTPLAIGVAAALAYLLFSRRARSVHADERSDVAREALGADNVGDAAALATAMRLHDNLSGAVTLGSAVARSHGDDEVLAVATRVLAVARIVRADLAAPAHDARTSIERYARALGVPLTLDLDRAPDAPDVVDLALELIGNQAKHAGSAPIAIAMTRARAAWIVDVSHAPFSADRGGRGLRWLSARVAARGGTIERTARGTRIVFPDRNEAARWLGALEFAFYPAAPMVAWALHGSGVEIGVVAGLSTVLFAIHLNNARVVGQFARADRRRLQRAIANASRAPRAFATGIVDRAIAQLSDATSADEARRVLPAIACDLDDALSLLERSASPQEAAPNRGDDRLGAALHP